MSWDTTSNYFSGQGVVLIGERDALGKPKGLIPVGNVSDLKIQVATSVLEHKESQTGAKAIDLRLTTETKASLSMTLESFTPANLLLALRADVTTAKAGSVVGEAIKLYNGKILALGRMKAAAVVLKRGATALTAYSNDATPYDYKVNLDNGSVYMNDGSVIGVAALTTGGTAATAITVAAQAVITIVNTAVAGDKVMFTGWTGADAAFINSKLLTILAATAANITVDLDTTGKTIAALGSLSAFDGQALAVDYTFSTQQTINALTQGVADRYLRFEGLNTADSNKPVVVEVFRFSVDPLKELALIGDGVNKFDLQGNVLLDSLQVTGSKYFRQTMLS